MSKATREGKLRLVTSEPAMRRPKHVVTLNLTAEEFGTLSALARNHDTTREGAVVWMLEAAGELLTRKPEEDEDVEPDEPSPPELELVHAEEPEPA